MGCELELWNNLRPFLPIPPYILRLASLGRSFGFYLSKPHLCILWAVALLGLEVFVNYFLNLLLDFILLLFVSQPPGVKLLGSFAVNSVDVRAGHYSLSFLFFSEHGQLGWHIRVNTLKL